MDNEWYNLPMQEGKLYYYVYQEHGHTHILVHDKDGAQVYGKLKQDCIENKYGLDMTDFSIILLDILTGFNHGILDAKS